MTEASQSVECTREEIELWAPYERMLREWLERSEGPTVDQIDMLVDRVRPCFLRWVTKANQQAKPALQGDGWSVQMPGGEGHFDRLQQWIATLTFGLLQEIVIMEAHRASAAASAC